MDLTVVLVGPTGHGKSAIGNRILGREAFLSRARLYRVTKTCELQTSVLEHGQTITVIDTPGFVDTESELHGEEVNKCLKLARNRIHAILFVVSLRQRISIEDQKVAVQNLQTIFGNNIISYMIVVYADVLDDALSLPLKNHDIILLSEGRFVIFDNTTKDEVKKSEQVQNLLSQVKTVMSKNGRKPFMSQVFERQLHIAWRLRDDIAKAQAASSTVDEGAKGYLKEEVSEQIDKSFEERMTQSFNVVESTVRDVTTRLERLEEAHATTINANKEQTTQIIDVVEARLRDTTSLEQQMEAATMKAGERAEKYFKEATSELIQRISKSYEEQMTQRLEAVEARLRDTTTSLEQQMETATLKADERAGKYFKEATSELIQQMTQRINEVVSSVKEVTTKLEQQLAEAEAARLKAGERAQEAQKNSDDQIQTLKEVLERAESRVKDVTIRLEQQLAEAEAARLKADERAQEAQKNSEEQIQKPYWKFGVKPFIYMFMLILPLLWDQYRQTYSNVK